MPPIKFPPPRRMPVPAAQPRPSEPIAQASAAQPPVKKGGLSALGRHSPASVEGERASVRTAQQPAPEQPQGQIAAGPTFGRQGWPPPPGAGYMEILDWASGGLPPSEEDVQLAIYLLIGIIPHPGQSPIGYQKDDRAVAVASVR